MKIDRNRCIWKGTAIVNVQPCQECKKETTGRAKDVYTKKETPLCESCARRKGLA